MRPSSLVILVTLSACEGEISSLPTPAERPTVETVAAQLVDGTPLEPTEIAMGQAPSQLGSLHGVTVAASAVSVWLAGEGAFEQLPSSDDLGAIKGLSPRGDGLWVATSTGLFHESQRQLLRSPASDVLVELGMRSVDSVGTGADEVLWLLTDRGVARLAGGVVTPLTVSLPGETLGFPDAVVGLTADRALVAVDGFVFRVDVAARTVVWLAEGVGAVRVATRLPDGAAVLVSATGFYRYAAGTLERIVFPKPVTDVTVAGPYVTVVMDGTVARLESAHTAVRVGTIVPKRHGVTVDADGRTWAINDNRVVRFEAPPEPPGFEVEARPFLVAHCNSCHLTGKEYSPVLDFGKYSVAVAKADRILVRLRASTSPMPPEATEVLSPQDYAGVVRWVESGMKP